MFYESLQAVVAESLKRAEALGKDAVKAMTWNDIEEVSAVHMKSVAATHTYLELRRLLKLYETEHLMPSVQLPVFPIPQMGKFSLTITSDQYAMCRLTTDNGGVTWLVYSAATKSEKVYLGNTVKEAIIQYGNDLFNHILNNWKWLNNTVIHCDGDTLDTVASH